MLTRMDGPGSLTIPPILDSQRNVCLFGMGAIDIVSDGGGECFHV